MNSPSPDHLHIHGTLPLLDDATESSALQAKPSWRGWIHTGTFPLVIVLGVVLVAVADGRTARTGSAIFAVASFLLFGISALYHRVAQAPRITAILRQLDHANIFLLIAGTYTPISLLCLPQAKWVPLLVLIWGGAALGIGFRIFWMNAPRWLYVPIYLALGWASLVYADDFFDASRMTMTLILVGGILYSVGAVVYGLKRPNPIPNVFGFHEVFHALTVLAFLCHWIAVMLLATSPPMM